MGEIGDRFEVLSDQIGTGPPCSRMDDVGCTRREGSVSGVTFRRVDSEDTLSHHVPPVSNPGMLDFRPRQSRRSVRPDCWG
jgi:hypothetical protein